MQVLIKMVWKNVEYATISSDSRLSLPPPASLQHPAVFTPQIFSDSGSAVRPFTSSTVSSEKARSCSSGVLSWMRVKMMGAAMSMLPASRPQLAANSFMYGASARSMAGAMTPPADWMDL